MKEKNQKSDKEYRLYESAYNLFITNGINKTTIQDIVDAAGVAKGTFYLYFKDKYDIQEKLIIKLSSELFHNALQETEKNPEKKLEKQIISIINYVIDELIRRPELIKFISKDLSLGYYNDKITNLMENEEIGLQEVFMKGIKENNIKLKNPEVTLFMIIELVSSTCFTSITKNLPLPISEYKEYLYEAIINMIYTQKR